MMNKRLKAGLIRLYKDNQKMRFTLGTLTLVFICILLLITATFSEININIGDYIKFGYVPQIPVLLFIAALLAPEWALITVILYIILGLTPWFPVFALGGGPSYILQYNFGYILAYIFSVIICSHKFKNKPSFEDIILGVLYGVLIIHIIGIIYMAILALIKHESFEFIFNWIYYQSIIKLLFDIVISFVTVLIAMVLRKILWVVFA